MTKINDIIHYVETLAGHSLNRDEGVQHGDGDRTLGGVTVSWMASPDAIQAAGEDGHELLIAHESLYYPYDVINAEKTPEDCGIPMIETSHELSENPGLGRFTEMLGQTFPDVQFRFYENKCIWQTE